jgi:hypothetical protein
LKLITQTNGLLDQGYFSGIFNIKKAVKYLKSVQEAANQNNDIIRKMYDNFNQVTSTFERRARQLGCSDCWLCKAKNSQDTCWEEFDKQLLARLDDSINIMPSGEKGKLTRRFTDIIPSNTQEFKKEYDEQFLDALVEVVGYGWLQDKFPSHRVQFEEPDLVVIDGKDRLVAAMACKRIRTSDKNHNYFRCQRESHQVEARSVDNSVLSENPTKNPFLSKLQDTLSRAKGQLNGKDVPSKFIFLSFSFDVSAAISRHERTVRELIKREASDLQKSGITMIAFKDLSLTDLV